MKAGGNVKLFTRIVKFITNMTKWISFIMLIVLVPLVTFFSISRSFGVPIIGDIEIVQFSMVVLIMGSLAYTERMNSHITIGLLVDRFPAKVQIVLDFIAQLSTIVFAFIVCWAFTSKVNLTQTSDMLNISFVPFKIFLVICFIGWALEALLKFIGIVENYRTAEKSE